MEQEHKPKKPIWKRWWFWIMSILFIFIFFVNLGSKPSRPSEKYKTVSIEEIKKEAIENLSYEKLFRNNNEYIGKVVHYLGKVIQVKEDSGNSYILRANITKGKYDFWEDDVFLNYEGERVLEDDLIEFWGEVKGVKRYRTVMGASRSTPEIAALYLKVLEDSVASDEKSIVSEKIQTETEKIKKEIKTEDETKADIIKTNWEAFTSSIGTNWVIITGIIKNTGSTNIRLNRASGSVYNADGKVVGNSKETIYPSIIAPGEEAYVAVSIMDTVKKEGITDAKIQFSFEKTNKKPIKINAVNDLGKKSSFGYDVTGELENPSDERVENVRALVLFYDSEQNLVNAEVVYPEPNEILPHDTVAFKASSSHLENIIASYKVIGFSRQ